jgi:hypothetical protein
MISSLLWIPAGVANPHPRKYEFSTTEQELIQQLMVTPATTTTTTATTTTTTTSSDSAKISEELTLDIPNRRTDATNNNNNNKKNGVSVSKRTIQHPKIRPSHNLPPDLRMDEYSSDDDYNDNDDNDNEAEDDQNQNHENEEMRCQKNAAAIGRLLVGNHDNDTGKSTFPPNNNNNNSDDDDDDDEMENDNHSVMDDPDHDLDEEPHSSQHGELKENQHNLPNTTNRYHDDDDDDDDDDDLADVPDTREFEPLDVQGLEAMGISHIAAANTTTTTTTTDVEDRIQQRWNYDLLQEPGCLPVLHPDDDHHHHDDDSEADDVALTPDDALIVVAKTEDVRLLWLGVGQHCCLLNNIVDFLTLFFSHSHIFFCSDAGFRVVGGLCVRSKNRKSLCTS